MSQAKFITFEGGDGCGKTTQSKLLHQALESIGNEAIWTREPGGTEGADVIRALLVEGDACRWDGMTETLLHFAARRDHVEKSIRPAMRQGKWVVCDRFVDSTLAYQGYGHGLGIQAIKNLHNQTIGGFEPHLTFVFDMSVTSALQRTQQRAGVENRYEQMDAGFHERLRAGFLSIAQDNPDRCVVVDASQTIEQVRSVICNEVSSRFNIDLPNVQAA